MRRIATAILSIPFSLMFTQATLGQNEIFNDSFELCRTADVIEWDGEGDGTSWNDPLNWKGDAIPVDGDKVAIREGAGLTVEYSGRTTTLTCLGMTSNLNISSATLIMDGPATVIGNLGLISGTLTVNTQMSVRGTFSQAVGTTLNGPGTLTIGDLFTWAGGNQTGSGETIASAGVHLSTGNTKYNRERDLTLNGTSTWSAGPLAFGEGAQITLDAPLEITTDNAVTISAVPNPRLIINSTVTKSAGAGLTRILVPIDNNGQVVVSAGQLEIGSGNAGALGASSGGFSVAGGSTLTVVGSHQFGPSSSISGAGDFTYAGGTGVFEGTIDLTGTWTLTTGVAQFPSGASFAADVELPGGPGGAEFVVDGPVNITGTLLQTAGTAISGAGTLTIGGLFTWTGGSQTGSGGTIASAGVHLSTGNTKSNRERDLTLNGTSTWSAGPLAFGEGAQITLNAPLEITTDNAVTISAVPNPRLIINSTVTKSAGAGLTRVLVPIDNNGQVVVSAGQLEIGSGNTGAVGASSGGFSVAGGSTLTVVGSHEFGPLSSISGAGDFFYTGGTGVFEGAMPLTGTLSVSASTAQFPAAVSISGDVEVLGGPGGTTFDVGGALSITGALLQEVGTTVSGTGTLTVGGLFTWTGGNHFGAGETIADGGADISGPNTKRWRERTLTLNASTDWTGTGNLDTDFGATLVVNAPFNIATDADFRHLGFAEPTITINDNLIKTAGTDVTQLAANITNAGTIASESGRLQFTKAYTQNVAGSLTVAIASAVDFDLFEITGLATLGGSLDISLLGGYLPELGDSFEILTASTVSGTFDTVNGTAITAGRRFDVVYGASSVTLTVVADN
jgi:hypothetical protein